MDKCLAKRNPSKNPTVERIPDEHASDPLQPIRRAIRARRQIRYRIPLVLTATRGLTETQSQTIA